MDIDSLAAAWSKAWEGSDTDAFLALFTEDAVYRDDQVNRLNRGHADLRPFHEHFAAALSNVRLEVRRAFQSGENALFEWHFSGDQTGPYHGRPPSNRHFEQDGVSLLTLAPDGKVKAVVDYYDSGGVSRQLDQ